MTEEYDNTNRITVFKNTDTNNERAPHWTGYINLGSDLIDQIEPDEEGNIRVSLWKVNKKDGKGFFLSGQVQAPYKPDQSEDDGWDDEDAF